MRIRPERPTDAAAVAALHTAAFGDHGTVVNAIVHDLRPTIAELGGCSLVAVEDGGTDDADRADDTVVGHLMITMSLLDAPDRLRNAPVLSPLAVAPARQGRGIGSALVRHALDVGDAEGWPFVVLEGDPAYYGRLGFVTAEAVGIRRPSLRIPETAFQAHPLAARTAADTGTLLYAWSFWAHDAVGLRD